MDTHSSRRLSPAHRGELQLLQLGSAWGEHKSDGEDFGLTVSVMDVVDGLPSLRLLVQHLSRVCTEFGIVGHRISRWVQPEAKFPPVANNKLLTCLPVKGRNTLDPGPHVVVLWEQEKRRWRKPWSLRQLLARLPLARFQMHAPSLMAQLCLHGPCLLGDC
jgi:hypothetical protein